MLVVLTGLQLNNIALIDSLELDFCDGFTVLTGEIIKSLKKLPIDLNWIVWDNSSDIAHYSEHFGHISFYQPRSCSMV